MGSSSVQRFTCEQICGAPRPSLCAVSLGVCPPSLCSPGRGGALHKRAPGTHGSDNAPRHYGDRHTQKSLSPFHPGNEKQAAYLKEAAGKFSTFRKTVSSSMTVCPEEDQDRHPSHVSSWRIAIKNWEWLKWNSARWWRRRGWHRWPGVVHSWGAVLPLSLPVVCPLPGSVSLLLPLILSTGIIVPGLGVVHHHGPRWRDTAAHRWRISTWKDRRWEMKSKNVLEKDYFFLNTAVQLGG